MYTFAEDPSNLRAVELEPDRTHGLALNYQNKPKDFMSGKIDSCIYCFNIEVLKLIDDEDSTLEGDLLPFLCEQKQLYVRKLEGFWADITAPKDLLFAQKMYLKEFEDSTAPKLPSAVGNVLIHPSAIIDPTAIIGPNVIIGANCKVGKGVRILNSALFEGAEIKGHTFIKNSIIGWRSIVGSWVRIEGISVLAEDVIVMNEIFIN